MRRRSAASRDLAIILGFAAVVGWGCEGGSARVTGPTGTATVQTQESPGPAERRVTADLRDRFLFEHNARFFRSRTFRWVPPVPIHFVTGDSLLDPFFTQQFGAWEGALAGAGGRPFYEVHPMAQSLPARGIFFVIDDLPGRVAGHGDPFSPLGESPRGGSAIIQGLRQRVARGQARQVEIPEVQANGVIQRCQITLDPLVEGLSDELVTRLVRHEIGHCLGFIGHVPRGLMTAAIDSPQASRTITSDVSGMMRKLYRLDPGTRVTR